MPVRKKYVYYSIVESNILIKCLTYNKQTVNIILEKVLPMTVRLICLLIKKITA